ncbi:DNA ligase [Paenibacillus sp. 11B]|nr:DNA ligase [Paenibacillus sp. 11B]MDN8593139.1 DNA ligase [Paenibacillus sp. 11B]
MLNKPLKPMLLQPLVPGEIKKDWKSSIKWDGFRILIHYDYGRVRAYTRHGTEVTERFPELQEIKLSVKTAILDGECIAFDVTQQTDQPPKIWWDDAMTRFHTKKSTAVKSICKTLKAHFPIWDVLWVDGQSVTTMTFDKRRELLQTLLTPSETISITPLYDDGLQLFLGVKQQGLEGIVQYNSDAPYFLNSRPKNVITKIKAYQYVTCQVSATRKGAFGWGLQLNGKYVGVLEFPPHRDILSKFHHVSKKLVRNENKNWIYLEPVLSCKVRFQCFTKDGKLRSPIIEELVDLTVA